MPGKNHESRKLLEERDRQIEERICACLGIPRTNAPREAPDSGRGAIPVASFLKLADALKRYLLADPDGEVPPYVQVIEEVMKTVVSCDEEQTAARRGVLTELDRWSTKPWESATLVDFLRIIAARALMPAIWGHSIAWFKKKGVPVVADREDLSTLGIEKLLKKLESGKVPRGNFGAYVSKMRWRIFVDYLRKLRRTRARFAEASDAVERPKAKGASVEQSMLTCFLKELPPIHRAIIHMRWWGDTWEEVAKALGITEKEALQLVQDIVWPGGLSGRRISRRNARSHCRSTFASTSMSA